MVCVLASSTSWACRLPRTAPPISGVDAMASAQAVKSAARKNPTLGGWSSGEASRRCSSRRASRASPWIRQNIQRAAAAAASRKAASSMSLTAVESNQPPAENQGEIFSTRFTMVTGGGSPA
jgi:hypothetical protein